MKLLLSPLRRSTPAPQVQVSILDYSTAAKSSPGNKMYLHGHHTNSSYQDMCAGRIEGLN
jgi:hypothetical protein